MFRSRWTFSVPSLHAFNCPLHQQYLHCPFPSQWQTLPASSTRTRWWSVFRTVSSSRTMLSSKAPTNSRWPRSAQVQALLPPEVPSIRALPEQPLRPLLRLRRRFLHALPQSFPVSKSFASSNLKKIILKINAVKHFSCTLLFGTVLVFRSGVNSCQKLSLPALNFEWSATLK